MVLFNQNQRKLFNLLPKPGIFNQTSQITKHFSINSILEEKKERSKKNSLKKVFENLEDEPSNRRMIELMGESFVEFALGKG